MDPLRRLTHLLAPVLSLTAGLILGAGIGLPTAHWVAGYLIRTPAAAAASGSVAQPSPTARPQPSSGSSPAPATPAPPSIRLHPATPRTRLSTGSDAEPKFSRRPAGSRLAARGWWRSRTPVRVGPRLRASGRR